MTKICRVFAISGVAAALLATSGCTKHESQAEMARKLDEMQKQLDDTKKQLEQAGSQAAPSQPGQATPPAASTPAPKSAGASSGLQQQVSTNKENIASNKEAIAANKNAIATNSSNIAANKQAIATNKDAIATNASNIEKNRQGVEEAKKMAAPGKYHTIPAGTTISVRTGGKISTKSNSNGSLFEATLAEPLVVDGYTVAGTGATVEGIVANSDPGGKVKGVATISLAARSVIMEDGRRLPLRTSSEMFEAQKSGKKDALKVGIASGVGAAIGAIAGGGKGAAIGAGVGAGGGTGAVLMTKGEAAEVPPETVLTLRLSSDVRFQELRK